MARSISPTTVDIDRQSLGKNRFSPERLVTEARYHLGYCRITSYLDAAFPHGYSVGGLCECRHAAGDASRQSCRIRRHLRYPASTASRPAALCIARSVRIGNRKRIFATPRM